MPCRELRQRFLKMPQILQYIATAAVRFSEDGLERDRPVVGHQRFGGSLQVLQRNSSVVVRLGKVGLERDRPVVGHQRFRGPLQVLQRNSAIVMRLRKIGLERDRLVVRPPALLRAASDPAAQDRDYCNTLHNLA